MTIAARIEKLPPRGRALLARRLASSADGATATHQRLVAHVVADPDQTVTADALRAFLTESLPEYMVPWQYVMLPTMPVTPNGKIDRDALPAPEVAKPGPERSAIGPRSREEGLLLGIWREVLGQENIDVRSSFFELGGDSILSLQMVSRARQAGLFLSPRQVFEHQTIAELAAHVAPEPEAGTADRGPAVGEVPLTPIQHYFFDQEVADVHHWNMALTADLGRRVDPERIRGVLEHLLGHHDALRLRFQREGSGWAQAIAEPEADVPFARLDLSTLPRREQDAVFDGAIESLQRSLNLETGPLVQWTLFEMGADRPARMFMVAHHTAIDGVSWRILLDDFETAYAQLEEGDSIELPAKTTSFRQWGRRLAAAGRDGKFDRDAEYWSAVRREDIPALPVDHADGSNVEASARCMSDGLNADETRLLLDTISSAFRTQIDDVLRMALLHAFCRWTGSDALWVDLEGHGRQDVLPDVDLSRTVGWFTCLYPVLLRRGDAADVAAELKSVKEQVRQVPNRGIGYGVLRYLAPDGPAGSVLRGLPAPRVYLNYLGQFDSVGTGPVIGEVTRGDLSATRDPRARRTHLIEVTSLVLDGRLQVDWTYSENVHRAETIARVRQDFMDVLRAMVDHCRSPDAGGFTPSDFPDAGLDQAKLDQFIDSITDAGEAASRME